eukprot:c28230_g1_i1.p1 GENE.c28230_g1_i1~~c28230_g1_i1.p1  ORF type:complete len:196 (-),score=28.57 c28230_g1_i1:16-603(-)
MGADGLALLSGAETRHQAIRSLGSTDRWLRGKLEGGQTFHLVVFERPPTFVLATWDNILDLAGNVFPNIKPKLEAHRAAIQEKSFDEIQQLARSEWGESFLFYDAVEVRGMSDPRCFDEHRLEQASGTLWEVRSFLYHMFGVSDLFAGTGRTTHPDCRDSCNEYLTENVLISELPGAVTMPWITSLNDLDSTDDS